MGNTFGSIARGLGQFGSDIGRGTELLRQQRLQDFEQELARIRSQGEQKRLGFEERGLELREKEAKQPRVIGTHQDMFGNLYVVEQDPESGKTSARKVLDAQTQDTSSLVNDINAVVQQVPKEHQARLQALLKPYIDRGDYVNAMKLAGSYAEKLMTNVPATTQEWEAYRKALGHEPTAQDVLRFRRNPPQSGVEVTLPERHLKALADKWANEGIKPPAKYQAAVEEYMEDRDMKVKIKKTPQEQRLLDVANQIEPKVAQLKKLIEDAHLTDSNDWVFGNRSALMQHLRMGEYKLGKSPDQLGADLIRASAALQVMGAAPWTQIGRGKYMFETVTQHLPNPTDTPKNLYDKAIFLQGIVDELRQSMPDQGQEQEKGDPFDIFGPRK